jgi:hypothetical protein
MIRGSFGALIQDPPGDTTPTALEAGSPFQSEVYTIKSPIPGIDDRMLGSVIVKAWREKYDSADQSMQDTQNVIRACGHKIIGK